jgi:hypothetical protein
MKDEAATTAAGKTGENTRVGRVRIGAAGRFAFVCEINVGGVETTVVGTGDATRRERGLNGLITLLTLLDET